MCPSSPLSYSGPRLFPVSVFGAMILLLAVIGGAEAQTRHTPEVFALARDAQLKEDMPFPQKGGVMSRMHGDLVVLHFSFKALTSNASRNAFRPENDRLLVRAERVLVDAVGRHEDDSLLQAMGSDGLVGGQRYQRTVSGWFPIAALNCLGAVEELVFVRPSYYLTREGSVTSQGDIAQRSDLARANFGLTGAGVTVGLMSDSYDCLGGAATDVSTGDLPDGVVVLEEFANCGVGSDEARAMAQIVHDVAPGAALQIHTAGNGIASFAQGIGELQVAGSQIITDDVIYLAEAAFQDDLVAQAADAVSSLGVLYVSAAGNSADNAYLSSFKADTNLAPGAFPIDDTFSPDPAPVAFFGGDPHDFLPVSRGEPDAFQQIQILEGASIFFSFQWGEPFFSISGGDGALRDFDFYIFDDPPTTVLGGGASANLNGDAVEVFRFTNPVGSGVSTFNVMIVLADEVPASLGERGPPLPFDLYYTWFENTLDEVLIDEYDTNSGTIYGHPNAASVFAIGAVAYFNTPPFGQSDPQPEPYTSVGGVPILFQETRGGLPFLRDKPIAVSPTGGDTTFFGVDTDDNGSPNFFGTSAAAPHFAGLLAILFFVFCGYLSRGLIKEGPFWIVVIALFASFDMCIVGPDEGTGVGFVDAQSTMEKTEAETVHCSGFEDGTTSEWD